MNKRISCSLLLLLETYQAAENSTYPGNIDTFGPEGFPPLDPILHSFTTPPAWNLPLNLQPISIC